MPDSESFDAFYARTVASITSQMHALAGDDTAADHAIREAYARAYQQWYQVSSYPDTEGWLLAIAKEAYQRRRPMAAGPVRGPARPGHDPLSMPGMFRPAAAHAEPAATGDTTLPPSAASPADGRANGWFTPAAGSPATVDDDGAGGAGPAPGISGLFGGRAQAPANPAAIPQLAGDQRAIAGPPTEPTRPWRPGRVTGAFAVRRRPSVSLIALVTVVVLAAAGGIAYLVTSGNPAGRAASHGTTTAHGKKAVQMLPAGRTGSISAIPWSLVGSGWTLAEVSSAQAGTGLTGSSGSITTYLVDPEGGKYQVQTSPGPAPQLLGWSGNAQNALFAVPSSAGTGVTYDLLSLTSGGMSPLPLPPGVTAVGFTRPDGLNILAVSQNATAFQLERFNLQGAYQATIGSLPVKPGVTPSWQNCGIECGALSSPDGLFAVWGVDGDQMQLLSNAGGPVVRALDVPDSGSPPSCAPVAWWTANTVLASCAVTGAPNASRLWLVPASGGTPTALTAPSGSPSGNGDLVGAWQAAGAVYINVTNSAQCLNAASGPGGLALDTVSGGALQPVSVSGATNNHTSVVSASGDRLLLLAQTGCPSSSSLVWLNPSTGATQILLSAPTTQAGVIAAVPYGNGPSALSAG